MPGWQGLKNICSLNPFTGHVGVRGFSQLYYGQESRKRLVVTHIFIDMRPEGTFDVSPVIYRWVQKQRNTFFVP
jgi:hypothetical protein